MMPFAWTHRWFTMLIEVWHRLSGSIAATFRAAAQWWGSLSHVGQHWGKNVVLGVGIELFIHAGGHGWHLQPIVSFQDWGLDVTTRLTHATCSITANEGGAAGPSRLGRWLDCPGSTPQTREPLLLDVDESTWRSSSWGGGEPWRAPRDRVADLVERSFDLGAQQVVVDIQIADMGPADSSSSEASIRALADEDARFGERLRKLLDRPSFGPEKLLILVRSERAPLAPDRLGFQSELRRSPVVDSVVAASGGRIVLAAPYFQVAEDLVTRDWDLFRVTCERLAEPVGAGALAVVPSVQLVTFAHRMAIHGGGAAPMSAIMAHSPLQIWAKSPELSAVSRKPSCTPIPQSAPSLLDRNAQLLQRCRLDITLSGHPAGYGQSACRELAKACDANATKGSSVRSEVCAGFQTVKAPTSPPPGLRATYWAELDRTLAGRFSEADVPKSGSLGNRIVFRIADDNVLRVSAMDAGNDSLAPLFDKRTVVIGQTFAEANDRFMTPLGPMPGAMVLVNAIDSMGRHGLLQPPKSLWTVLNALALIIVVGYLFAKWDSFVGMLLATSIVIMTAGLASFFLFADGIWLDFAAPILGIQIHSVWAGFEERQRLKAALRQTHH